MQTPMVETTHGADAAIVQSTLRGDLAEQLAGHIGRYDVTAHRCRDILPLLNARDVRGGRQWRRDYGMNAVKAALELRIVSPAELDTLLLWEDRVENLITNLGLNNYLSRMWKASSYTAQHYLGLIDGTTPTIAAGDTMSSHSGWTEFTEYDTTSGDRPDLTAALGSVASQSLATSAAIPFLVTTDSLDCNGAFITTSAAVGATGGDLEAAGTFTQGNKSVDDGDQLSVTVTLTQAAA